EPILEGLINVKSADGLIESGTFKGQYVNSESMSILTAAIRSHFTWSDSDVQTAIVRADGKYGPEQRAAFIRHLDVDRFVPVLGTIRRTEVTFLWRPESGRSDPD